MTLLFFLKPKSVDFVGNFQDDPTFGLLGRLEEKERKKRERKEKERKKREEEELLLLKWWDV